MSYEDKYNNRFAGVSNNYSQLTENMFADADNEIADLKAQLAASIPKELVEALSDEINQGINRTIGRFLVIQKIKKLLSNQPEPDYSLTKSCNFDLSFTEVKSDE